MSHKRTVASGLLCQDELDQLGQRFTRVWPVQDTSCFEGLLLAIDDADHELWRRGRKCVTRFGEAGAPVDDQSHALGRRSGPQALREPFGLQGSLQPPQPAVLLTHVVRNKPHRLPFFGPRNKRALTPGESLSPCDLR